MKAVLLLAGKGTRFLPLTENIPKPLIQVAGAPVLAHILASLRQVKIDELILITGYLDDHIRSYMHDSYPDPYRIIRQDRLDGTGGAVYAAKDYLDGPVLVVFGDTIFEADLSGLNGNQTDNLIWTRSVEDYQRFGIVQTDAHGHMREIIEKPQIDIGRNANIGLYFIADHRAFLAGLERVMAKPPINGEYYVTYALNDMVTNGCTIKVKTVQGWHDCGTLGALVATNNHLLAAGQSAPVQNQPGVTIIPPVRIAEGVHLQDCNIGPNVTIAEGCRITSSSIAHSIIGPNCNLDILVVNQSLIGEDTRLSRKTIESCIVANGKIRSAG
jgi:glucose-1-phosphate thymidylyltransferase